MTTTNSGKIFLLTFILLCFNRGTGQNTIGQQYGFSIDIPRQWQSTRLVVGDTVIFRFKSFDSQIYMEVEMFPLEDGFHIFDLVDGFEKHELPPGFDCSILKDYSSANRVKGKMGIYYGYINGEAESITVFYFINKNKGCIMSTTVPVDRRQEKTEVLLSVFDSFKFLNQ
jgi:hypothetical protein